MALARARRDRGIDYWPGFVDALSTLILGIIFLLTVFVVVQFFLSQEVTGKDTALQRLSARIAQLTDLLALEQTGKTSLEEQIAQLRANLATTESERDRYKGLYEGLSGGNAAAQDKANELTGKLDAEKQVSLRALAQVEVLNQQIAALRRQLGALEQALEVSEKKDKESQSRLADLGQRLNVALAQRVQELSRYRSDFFGRLREILGNRPDIRVVGDRFVLQSEVFFDTGQSVLKPEGRAELDKIAAVLLDVSQANPAGHRLGAARRRPHRRAPDRRRPHQLGPVGRARHRGGAIPDQQGHAAAAPGRRRLRRVPADRSRPPPKRPTAATAASS